MVLRLAVILHTMVYFIKLCKSKFSKYIWGLLGQGVYVAPSQFEAGFVSLAHTAEDVENTIRAVDNVFSNL